MSINKGFIKDWLGNTVLPITRGELVLDQYGNVALTSQEFLAGENGNQYGLITATERALLSGGGSGGITDIYTKLGHINTGLKVNNAELNFYNKDTGVATPISIASTGDGNVNITVGTGNYVNIALTELTTTETTVTQILKGITVDKFGRVTAVTGEALLDSEIPVELTGKTLKESVLDGCTTAEKEIANNEKAIANKAYVDAKFQEVTGIATGALKFGGALSDATVAENALTNTAYLNHYFKVTKEFVLSTGDLHDTSGIIGTSITVKVGDTLIVHSEDGTQAKFVYIPSGDDITAITVFRDGDADNVLTSAIGQVSFRYSSVFSVTNPSGGNTAYIAMSPASSVKDGYLSATDYAKFSSYADSLKVTYEGKITTGVGVYEIGTLTIGTDTNTIYGKYNISSLSLENGTDTNTAYNPILKFTETGADDVNIVLKGYNGIIIKKNGNDVEFSTSNEVEENSTDYLSINGNKFGVKIGSLSGQTVTPGLTDYAEFSNFRANVLTKTLVFDIISDSLKDTTKTYYYGSTVLAEAVAVTI